MSNEPALATLTLKLVDGTEKKEIEERLEHELNISYGVSEVYVEETDDEKYISIQFKLNTKQKSITQLKTDLFFETQYEVEITKWKTLNLPSL